MLIYFGHSRRLYNTEKEKKALRIIRDNFPKCRILNPNKDKHQEGCMDEHTGVAGSEMKYFLNLTRLCRIGVFLIEGDEWTPGSHAEAKYMWDCVKPIYRINLEKNSVERIRVIRKKCKITFEEERQRLIRDGKFILAGENG